MIDPESNKDPIWSKTILNGIFFEWRVVVEDKDEEKLQTWQIIANNKDQAIELFCSHLWFYETEEEFLLDPPKSFDDIEGVSVIPEYDGIFAGEYKNLCVFNVKDNGFIDRGPSGLMVKPGEDIWKEHH